MIGNTPFIKLVKISSILNVDIYVKVTKLPYTYIYAYNSTAIIVLSIQVKANNPGGSGKDRAA